MGGQSRINTQKWEMSPKMIMHTAGSTDIQSTTCSARGKQCCWQDGSSRQKINLLYKISKSSYILQFDYGLWALPSNPVSHILSHGAATNNHSQTKFCKISTWTYLCKTLYTQNWQFLIISQNIDGHLINSATCWYFLLSQQFRMMRTGIKWTWTGLGFRQMVHSCFRIIGWSHRTTCPLMHRLHLL